MHMYVCVHDVDGQTGLKARSAAVSVRPSLRGSWQRARQFDKNSHFRFSCSLGMAYRASLVGLLLFLPEVLL